MTFDCSGLANNVVDTSNTNESIPIIWLQEDRTIVFNEKYWAQRELFIGLIVFFIIFMIPCACCVVYGRGGYKHHDKIWRVYKLENNGIFAYREEVIPILQEYINDHNVIGMILDLANVVFTQEMVDIMFESTISGKPITQKYLRKTFCRYLLLSMLSTPTYILTYHPVTHFIDSYRSFVETECIALDYYPRNCGDDDNPCTYGEFMYYQIDMEGVCDPGTLNINSHLFYSKLNVIDESRDIETCYIGQTKNNQMNVRMIPSYWCGECLGRCGYCCTPSDGLCGCCGANVCGYCYSIICAATYCWVYCRCICERMDDDLVGKYKIKFDLDEKEQNDASVELVVTGS